MMKGLTRALRQRLPRYAMIANEPDPLVQGKFLFPFVDWAWYPIAFDGYDTFWGLMDNDFPEMGYFSLQSPLTIDRWYGVQQDLHFTPCRLSQLRTELGIREDEL